jgi:hypothetical protein
MPAKPKHASDYDSQQVAIVKATCLYVATKLGDLIDQIVIAGGLVPSLIIGQGGVEPHVGTLDLDIGLAIGLLDGHRYEELARRLRQADFSPDVNDDGQPTRQRWTLQEPHRVTVDFLMPPTRPGMSAGSLQNIEHDLAAIITPGLHLAFVDRIDVPLEGITVLGEKAKRSVQVCGPAAFVVLKALAFRNRGENKDAYDLIYVLRSYGSGVQAVAQRLLPLKDDPAARLAFRHLGEDFSEIDSVGPRRVADFLHGRPDDDIQADARGLVLDLLDALDM